MAKHSCQHKPNASISKYFVNAGQREVIFCVIITTTCILLILQKICQLGYLFLGQNPSLPGYLFAFVASSMDYDTTNKESNTI